MTLCSVATRYQVLPRNNLCLGHYLLVVPGHAYKYSTKNALHHGTMLRDVRMENLMAVLNPHKLKLLSKGGKL